MSLVNVSKLKPLRNDVLLTRQPEEQKGLIFVKEKSSETTTTHYFVRAVGDAVVNLKVGDLVIGDWRKMTNGFKMTEEDGSVVEAYITAEKEILAIVG